MGYNFIISGGFRLKKSGKYPWPCSSEPGRMAEIDTGDVFTGSEDGTYMKHTGLGTFGHVIPAEDLESIDGDVKLRLL